ncbi:uncharacterized protein LOC9636683 [Selaginella moellendorffii]|nr:uncharacterized protein LOC9636683 [Selaginella moellendorffii]|eukprot:XP_002989504.2 uncharacterized protein LOC9636683 [Selaginella moellendorffii]
MGSRPKIVMAPSPRRAPKVVPDKKRPLEIHIISAQRLSKVSYFQRTRAYAVAWIDSQHETKLSTPVDRKGGRNPSWNAILTFYVDTDDLVERHGINAGMTIEIYTKAWVRDKLIGSVRVLIADLVKGMRESKGLCLSFMVIRPSGLRKGLLNLGVRPERLYYDDDIVVYQPPPPPQPGAARG